jgi:hypothetical protein
MLLFPATRLELRMNTKLRLKEQFNIDFNNLFCLTNMPVGRFLDYLNENGNYENYITELVNSFNPAAAQGVMCRNTLSVGPERRHIQLRLQPDDGIRYFSEMG